MSSRYDAYWRDMQDNAERHDGAPDVRVLWDKVPTARKEHRCDSCGDPIEAGQKYESRGLIEDGTFRQEKVHRFAYGLGISGCPRVRERDLADARDQFAKDEELFNHGVR